MNKANILSTAKDIFSNFVRINEDLYRGELQFDKQKVAGIFYLDFNKELSNVDFKEYQENLLAKDYFSNRGNIQWNYYLLLFHENIDARKKFEIEKDDRYARKYVFTENDFNSFFKLKTPGTAIDFDIVTDWKNRLDKVDLQEVYSANPVQPAIERFLSNLTEKQVKSKVKDIKKVLRVKTIDQIKFTPEYRPYPRINSFDFKKVNLFKGTNGVGKTSLLESIELILCGKTKRNPSKVEAEGVIEAIVNKSELIRYSAKNSEVYRQRDSYWYSNNYPTRNNLYESFSRYNYFNTDAAYTFSNSNNETEIKKALFNLVLGNEYNYIRERGEKFYHPLRTELNKLESEIEKHNKIIRESSQQIESLCNSDNLQVYQNNITQYLEKLKPKSIAHHSRQEEYSLIEEFNNRLSSVIQKIKTNKFYIRTVQDLQEKFASFSKRKETYDLLNKQVKDLDVEKGRIQNNLQIKDQTLSLVKDSLKYFSDIRLFDLHGLDAKYTITLREVNKIKQILEVTKEVSFSNYNLPILLPELLENKKLKLARLKEDKLLNNKLLSDNLSKLDKLEKTIKELKLSGRKYISLSPYATNCPLCNTQLTNQELVDLIEENFLGENKEDIETKKLYDKQLELDKEIIIIESYLKDLEKIQNAYLIIYPKEGLHFDTLDCIVSDINNYITRINQLKEQQDNLDAIKSLASLYNVSEREFSSISIKLSNIYSTLSFSYENKEKFFELKEQLAKEVLALKDDLEKISLRKYRLFDQLNEDLGFRNLEDIDLIALQDSLAKEETIINQLEDYFEKLSDIVYLNTKDTIDELELNSDLLSKSLNSYRSELKVQYEIVTAKKAVKESESFVDSNRIKLSRLQNAKEALGSLIFADDNQQLQEFFNYNLVEICDIFKTLHVPCEFTSIQFIEGELRLLDNKKSNRKISEVSTGQRSALALSIFISLNRKLRNGPNIIMFDDPVSFIDDLNALSFLDFLRYFVLKEDKQVFFATANTKLASLFEKKFHFLEDDFNVVPLEKNPELD